MQIMLGKASNQNLSRRLKYQSAELANLALWPRQPSTVCFTVAFHALSWAVPEGATAPPVLIQAQPDPPLYYHPDDFHNPFLLHHAVKAGELHQLLADIPRKNAAGGALRAFWAALTTFVPDLQYPLFWQGLESLFGSETTNSGVTKRLCQRISVFLAGTDQDQTKLFNKVKACYRMRSEIAHGRWGEGPELTAMMGQTEAIVRTVVRHLLEKPGMLPVFISTGRDAFPEKWVLSGSVAPPGHTALGWSAGNLGKSVA
jgi:Apea-like HEPN